MTDYFHTMRVKSLKEMAIKPLYEFICVVLSIQRVEREDSSTQLVKRKNLRQVLDGVLVGPAYKYIREELWNEYQDDYSASRPELITFLNHVVDGSFDKIVIGSNDHESQTCSQTCCRACRSNLLSPAWTEENQFYPINVVKTVSNYCPNLQRIALAFKTLQSDPVLGVSISLAPFEVLAELDLNWSTRSNCLNFFQHIGTSCKKLKILRLQGMPFFQEQQVYLVLGPMAELLPRRIREKICTPSHFLNRLQFDQKNLTPICHSLEKLSVRTDTDLPDNLPDNLNNCFRSSYFLLRQFSNLEKLTERPEQFTEFDPYYKLVPSKDPILEPIFGMGSRSGS